jgi:hypothetical protein
MSLSLPNIENIESDIDTIAGEFTMIGYIILFLGLLAIGLFVKSIFITFTAYVTGQLLGIMYLLTYGSLGTILDTVRTGVALILIIMFTVLEIVLFSPQKEPY